MTENSLWRLIAASLPLPQGILLYKIYFAQKTGENIMDLSKIIKDKIQFIEEKTGNAVIMEQKNSTAMVAKICIDFPNWNDRTNLPRILHIKYVDQVHILHELIHLEKFFVDQYSIVACNDKKLHNVTDVFKDIPENYVAHKIIKGDYGNNPIDEDWFAGRDSIHEGLTDKDLAANLINFWAFSEFCPIYQGNFRSFKRNCERQKLFDTLSIANKTITVLENMDYKRKDSYDCCVEQIIEIFAPEYYNHGKIYPSYFSKEGNLWKWNP